MTSSKLSSYLASKYLSADPPSSSSTTKKRKRKGAAPVGLIIADDADVLGLSSTAPQENDDEGRPITVNSGSAEFRKAKKNTWKVVGAPVLQPNDAEGREADRIIAEAAEEKRGRDAEDEGPVIEGDDGVVKMGDGTHAGLQTASSVALQFAKRKREEAAAWEAEERARISKGSSSKTGEETVYRDATGRRIDISMRRQEARKEQDEKLRKEKEEKEAQKGEVQKVMQQARKMELDEARFIPFARTVEDEDMNRELREVERWEDPAMEFLSKKEEKGKGKGGKFAGAPNRYGIRPGRRWDGVDRGNGWEDERFKALNRKTRNKDLGFAWEMDE